MGALSTVIAGIGGGLWASGELAHIQNLKDMATQFQLRTNLAAVRHFDIVSFGE